MTHSKVMNPERAYAELVRLAHEEALLASCSDLLEWDEETCMPRGGVEHRSAQMALLAGLIHDRRSDPRYEDLLSEVEASALAADPASAMAVNVRELRREFDRERRLPRALVVEITRVAALASQAWADARERSDFASLAPWLERTFALAREEAAAIGYAEVPYDALLEHYEPGMTTSRIATLFAGLEAELLPMVAALRAAPSPLPAHVLRREFPVERQRLFAETVAATLGFDMERGRLDAGAHPFCMAIGPGDIRIALRFHKNDFATGLFTLLHEVGHALYDQGLDPAHHGTPMGDAPSLGLHESQSRLWENLVGRSEGFWRHFYPVLRNIFHEALHDVGLDVFRRVINRVLPGPIRARADEITYNLHILIRFQLERALLDDDLRVSDLPGAWTESYQRYLGITPRHDYEGCLQDGHWAEGLIGYFPTYTLGNVYAAQLFAAAERAVGPLEEAFARGDFAGLRSWLGENVHGHGKRYAVPDLIQHATGFAPDPAALIDNLKRRYPLDSH
jgi:carboxypeptidase Taq